MNVPDARRATREGGVRHGPARGAVLVALMVALGSFAVPALADVTRSDIRAAEAVAAAAAADLRAAEAEHPIESVGATLREMMAWIT